MTIKYLYKWAEKHNAVDLDIEIQWRDGGGCYDGTDMLDEQDICIVPARSGENTNDVVLL